ncbi:methyltransferase domain-containing protein [bacterium]|nr:methyltransferase domain-containing protein [bacterium]MDB2392038.1 methyltransferase domain-containing protein [Acidimicrobiaceae bacterium]HAY69983.1 hypothetical protein [Acidimicrobiaceae bacterium]
MSTQNSGNKDLADHYSFGGLRERIEHGLSTLSQPPTVASLGAVDEFHVGGRPATAHLVEQLALGPADRVLDIGSGLGGTGRYIASSTGAAVVGVDVTEEYVHVARWLTELVGLSALVKFVHAAAADLPAQEREFSAATMVHVGMNLSDKAAVFTDIAAQLAPGSAFGIYDLLVTGSERPNYPVPWASTPTTSFLETADDYVAHLVAAGFTVEVVTDRSEAALAGIAHQAAATSKGSSPLGLHLVMGPATPTKFGNLVAAIGSGVIAPTEIIARSGGN